MSSDRTTDRTTDGSTGWFGRTRAKYRLGGLLVLAGIILFLVPEPATSGLGVTLIVVGAIVRLVSWLL